MRELDWKSFDVLVVDDEEDNLDAFRFAFRKSFNLHYALGGERALDALGRIDPAVIVSDQRMPGMSGIDFLRKAKELRPDAVGILLTAYADLAVLIDAVNSGAVERYIQKPWDSKELTVILRQAIVTFSTVRENRRLRDQLERYAGYLEREHRDAIDFGELGVESNAMKEVSRRLNEVAPTSSHVIVEGEAGSEMEIVARAIHIGSPREDHPFVKVICAAFRGDALERELFGWEKGAFEGALSDRPGRFEVGHRGTVYLEDPHSLTPSLQARLLRLVSDGEVERVGSTDALPVDTRLVIGVVPGLDAWRASDVLPELIARLNAFPIALPPLRDRPEDVGDLARHFLRKYARRNARAARSFSGEALTRLAGYAWPGNVRELENVIERAAVLSRGDVIEAEHLAFGGSHPRPRAATETPAPAPVGAAFPAKVDGARASKVDLDSQLDDIERRELLAAIERCAGNKAEVARSLGIQRTTLYYRLKRLGIDV